MNLPQTAMVNINDVDANLKQLFGVQYIEPGISCILEAADTDMYFYKTYIGAHEIAVERGDCVYWLDDNKETANLKRGPTQIQSNNIATVIRGYMPENKTSGITNRTCLPYVNGCSTKQIFPPDRHGDPTLQLLEIPPMSAEQAHHIHSTVRVVYILSGRGRSIVGMEQKVVVEDLYPGKVILLEKMCPHHFETSDEHMVCLPLHVFSSVSGQESNHPMFNGTHLTA